MYLVMNVCTPGRYHNQVDWVYVYFCDLEFEPLSSAVAPNPNPSKIKMAFCSQNKNASHWMDKIIYEAVFTREKNDVLYL